MGHWKTENALFQAEVDMLTANERDRREIEEALRRIDGRNRLIKVLRKRWKKQGFINISTDSSNPRWIHKRWIR